MGDVEARVNVARGSDVRHSSESQQMRGEVLDSVRRFADRVRAVLPVRQVILFGSHARGRAHEFSDIDVAVVTDSEVGNWLDASAELFRLRQDINLDIEPVLIDTLDDRSGFLAEIRRTGRIIYDRDAGRAA